MSDPNPFETIMQGATAYWLSRCLHIAANVGVADALGDKSATAAELAQTLNVNASAMGRILRLLSAHGVFAERDGRFSHTPASQMLRSDNPRSLRAFVQMIGSPICWQGFGALAHSLKTEKPAVEKVSPGGLFPYFAAHPDEARVFDAAMEGKAHGQVEMVLGAYDFSPFKTIADIGG